MNTSALWWDAPALDRGEVHVWLAQRGLLPLLLGGYLHTDPADLRIEIGEHGKPRLSREHRQLCFNISHSGAIAVYAVALDLELGVDIELLGRERDVLPIAGRAFGNDARRRLEGLSADRREHEFMHMWTRHEAQLKCLGKGLGEKPTQCWTTPLEVGERAVATLAAARIPTSVTCRRWGKSAPI